MNEQHFYEDLKRKVKAHAKKAGRGFNPLWQELALERFLARVSSSTYRDHFILKGGRLLSQYVPLGRETVDLDFLLYNFSTERLGIIIEEILSLKKENDFSFYLKELTPIDHASTKYHGHRLSLIASLAQTKTPVSIDIGVGDAISPLSFSYKLSGDIDGPYFEDSVELLVYPQETIFSEKLETVIFRGVNNTRMKDFYDLYFLIKFGNLNTKTTFDSITKTFNKRETPLVSKIIFPDEGNKKMNSRWAQFYTKLRIKNRDEVPQEFNLILKEINSYLVGLNKD